MEESAAKRPPERREAFSLVVVELEALAGDQFAQHSVLFTQICDRVVLVPLQPACDRHDEQAEWCDGVHAAHDT